MIEEEYYIIQGENFFKFDPNIHIVRKGMFLAQNETQMEDILLTFCSKFVYDDYPDVSGTIDDLINDWYELSGCDECYIKYEELNR